MTKLMVKGENNICSVFESANDEETIKNDNKIFFNKIDAFEEFEYIKNPDRVPNQKDNEWFFVYFESIEFKDEILELFNVFNSTGSYPNLSKNNLLNMQYFFYKVEDNIINIQNIKGKNYIKSNSFFIFCENIKYVNGEILTFHNKIDVFIDFKKEKIYFQNFNELKYFNNKFIEIYKEATQQESEKFTNFINNNINIFSINIPHSKIKDRNSKKIKYALDNDMLSKFVGKEKLIKIYIDKYISKKLEYKDNKFIIKENKDLTYLVEVIFEQHYTSAITEQHLLANGNEIVENIQS